MSIHTGRAFRKAASKGAAAATSYETWTALIEMPKRELAEIAMRLASLCCDSDNADAALFDGAALARVMYERDALRAARIT